MHVLGPANDGVDWAGLDALGASDALSFDDDGHLRWLVLTTCTVEWLAANGEGVRQGTRTDISTWWTAVDVGGICGHGFCIRTATRKPALTTLCLRQDAVETFYKVGHALSISQCVSKRAAARRR